MGFYGNITNTARTQFQFDKIYSNRYEMDNNKAIDGIYAGRYVLIEYDSQLNLDNFWRVELIATYPAENGVTYYGFNYNPSHNNVSQADTLLTKTIAQAADLQIVYTAVLDLDASNGVHMKSPKFFMYRPEILPESDIAYYEEISETSTANIPTYSINYNIDVKVYGAGRAYDSTVWQKAYIDGVEKYIMIAELNTVVPTFDVSADAPTQSPLVPHFDTHSTDVYYKLHWQPSWGMRVRSADNQTGPMFTIDGQEIEDSSTLYSELLKEPMSSDETTAWRRTEYDSSTGQGFTRYWNANTQKWEKDPVENIKAAIYYNKAGFQPEKISIKKEGQDRINLDPIGLSGHKYNNHKGLVGTTDPQVDIQELSIMLPSIGNSVAKMWNLIYGDFEQNDGSNNRNMDINWDSTAGLRLVNEDKTGHGFTYEPIKVETLAGAINSVHDLMGMIIEAPYGTTLDTDFAEAASEKYVYYSDGKYWRKATGYDYLPYNKTEIEENQEYSQVTSAFQDFPANKFCYTNLSGEYNIETNNYPSLNRRYYKNAVNENAPIFEPIDIRDFSIVELGEGKREPLYFRYDNGVFSNNEFIPTSGVNYYALNTTFEKDNTVTVENFNNKEYFEIIDGKVIPATSFDKVKEYYLKVFKLPGENNIIDKAPYEVGKYMLYINDAGVLGGELPQDFVITDDFLKSFQFCYEETINEDYVYYRTAKNASGQIVIEPIELFGITDNHYYSRFEGGFGKCEANTVPNIGLHYIPAVVETVEQFQAGDYYLLNEETGEYVRQYGWSPDVEDYFTTYKTTYYKFDISGPFSNFYFRDKYYTTKNNITYVIERAGSMRENVQYYIRADLEPVVTDGVYYIGSTYYYKVDNDYELDRNNLPTSGRTYYLRNNLLYVISDDNNLYDPGCQWNMNVSPIPEGVKLGTRKPYPTFEELKGFARELNTIHGLILKINYMLLYGDTYTRDQSTVQGCINVLNDIIAKFEFINPGEIMTVDSYGRIHSTPYTTSQPYNTYNYGKLQNNGNVSNIQSTEDRWIRLDIDPNAESPLITFKHEFTSKANTTTTADKNNGNGNGNNADMLDTIDLYAPIVDSTGHVVGHNVETVTLPYSYKFFNTTGNSTNSTTDLDTTQDSVSADGSAVTPGIAITATNMQADNTKDTMSINPYNKWIQTKFSNDKLEIAHEIHGVQTNVLATNLNKDNVASSSTNDKITIQDIAFDAAGHVTKNQAHTYTLPYGFKTVTPATQSTAVTNPTVNTTSIVAENTQDTLTLASSNKWIRMSANANSDTLSIGHEVHSFEAGTHSTKYGLTSDKDIVTLDANNTFEVPVFKFDEAGHITFAETHTINLPENFTNIKVLNTNASSVAVNGSSSTGTIAADTLTDTFTMDIGNRWIQINTDATNDKIVFYHAAPGNQTNTTVTGNETPNFGSTFSIPEVKYDEAGHISGISTHTVKIPQPSLNDLTATTSSVLTGISMVDTTGAITQTNANVGTLALTGYSLGTNSSALTATDTINTAFAKLQVQLNTEVSNRGTAVSNEATTRTNEIARLEGLITELTNQLKTLNETVTELKTKVDKEHPDTTTK